MRAVVYRGRHDIAVTDVPEPKVDAGQVRVRVGYNGICGTDLHEYYDGPIFVPTEPHPLTGGQLPVVLGQEFSGTVVEVGAGVSDLAEGDRITVEPVYRCGECVPCRAGRYNIWVETIAMGDVLAESFEALRAGAKMKVLVDPSR